VQKGELFRLGKLRIGYFSQHQTDELDVESTPYLAMLEMAQKKDPNVKESAVRAKLGAFGFGRDLADNKIRALSGGEKARLLFAFMSFDAPHMLLLDEPTNHLDIDAREALVNALNDYEGAIVIVSHDPTMVERVADRLWLVKDGKCETFEGDLDDYRKFTIQTRRDERKNEKDKKAKPVEKVEAPPPANDKAAQRKFEKMEKEIARLTKEKDRLESMMAEPDFYTRGEKIAETQKAYNTVVEKLAIEENAWLEAQA
jgi:ATP-binding cassette subfamily F protein 3